MSFFNRVWRVGAFGLVVGLLAAACADDKGAAFQQAQPPTVTGSISGKVTIAGTTTPVVGALVGTTPATSTALTDANGNYKIQDIPLPATGSASFAVTASKAGLETGAAATKSVSLSATAPNATADLQLTQPAGPPAPPTTGNLNVLVTNRDGVPQSGAAVTVKPASGATVTGTTDANGFALFTGLLPGAATVTATKTIAGITFKASGAANVRVGETAFLQLTLGRDFGQTVFPNFRGDFAVTATDIDLIPVTGARDNNPDIDCNVIRTQHMFVARVRDGTGRAISGAKVQWDLNISENGTISTRCPEFVDDPAGCTVPTVPGNTGSIIDSDDPDLNPFSARTGLNPAFTLDTRKAVTFTNDQTGPNNTVQFGANTVTVGEGQTWIIITSPVEGVTDVIVSTSDIKVPDVNCGLSDAPSTPCDKDFAIKRWVNWSLALNEVTWPNNPRNGDTRSPTRDPHDDAAATFTPIGSVVINVLARREDQRLRQRASYAAGPRELGSGIEDQLLGCFFDILPGVPGFQCELVDNRVIFESRVTRLRADSPFNISRGRMVWTITDDVPDVDFWGEDPGNNSDGCLNGVCNAEHNGPTDDQYWVGTRGGSVGNRNSAAVEFDANNNVFDGGVITANPLCTQPCDEDDFIGYGLVEVRLDPAIFFCTDGNGNGVCDPGAEGADSFSFDYARLLEGRVDIENTFRVQFVDEFGEVCGEITFKKRWVTSRLTVLKSTPDMVRVAVDEPIGPNVLQDIPIPVNTHTVQVGQTFTYRVTAIATGDVASANVRITDTLPRFGVQFDIVLPDAGAPTMRNGSQAFQFRGDRPTFDPRAVVYAIDNDDNDAGNAIDRCIVGRDGSAVGAAYVVPAPCFFVPNDEPNTIDGARAKAVSAAAGAAPGNGGGSAPDQVVWIQWFDDLIGRGAEPEDTVEITLAANGSVVNYAGRVPGTWCNIATVTDGQFNRTADNRPESFDADTLCHEVRLALLDIRKTTTDAVVPAGTAARFTVDIENAGSATLTNVVIHDTLDSTFRKVKREDIVLFAPFTGATVTINPDSFTFSVNIGNLPPTPFGGCTRPSDPRRQTFCQVYTLTTTTPASQGVFCNRVTAVGTNPAGTLRETDIACVTTTVAVELDIENEDGEVDATGAYRAGKEIFSVGDGGTARPDALIYRISVRNRSALDEGALFVVIRVGDLLGLIECRGLRASTPTDGEFGLTAGGTNPTRGAATACFGAREVDWSIPALPANSSAVLYLRAEAVRSGNDVSTAILFRGTFPTGPGFVAFEDEPTTVQ